MINSLILVKMTFHFPSHWHKTNVTKEIYLTASITKTFKIWWLKKKIERFFWQFSFFHLLLMCGEDDIQTKYVIRPKWHFKQYWDFFHFSFWSRKIFYFHLNWRIIRDVVNIWNTKIVWHLRHSKRNWKSKENIFYVSYIRPIDVQIGRMKWIYF